MSDHIIWHFGAYADTAVTTTVFDDGKRTTQTLSAAQLQLVDQNIDPWTILAALGETGDAVRYQILGKEYTSDEIENMIDNGDISLTAAGSIVFKGDTLEYADVGYEVHALLIDHLQDEINDINRLLDQLNTISATLASSDTFDEEQTITYDYSDGVSGNDEFFNLLKDQTAEMTNNERRELLQTANNDYIYWEALNVSATSDTSLTVQFGTYTLNERQFNMTFNENDISNALEALRNTVKEKTIQTETLSTDFQAANEQYTAVIAAMSQYAEDFYGSLNLLTE